LNCTIRVAAQKTDLLFQIFRVKKTRKFNGEIFFTFPFLFFAAKFSAASLAASCISSVMSSSYSMFSPSGGSR
jgi:hypothetical protein